jgi:hypothetical protein
VGLPPFFWNNPHIRYAVFFKNLLKSVAFSPKMCYNKLSVSFSTDFSQKGCAMPEILRDILGGVSGILTKSLVSAFPIINVLFILTAAGFGTMLHRKLSSRYRDIAALCLGGFLLLTGVSQLWDHFFVLDNGQLETTGTILVVVSLPLGYLFGEALLLDKGLAKLGQLLRRLFVGDSSAEADKGN